MKVEFRYNFCDDTDYDLKIISGWFAEFCSDQLGLGFDNSKNDINQIINIEINENSVLAKN